MEEIIKELKQISIDLGIYTMKYGLKAGKNFDEESLKNLSIANEKIKEAVKKIEGKQNGNICGSN